MELRIVGTTPKWFDLVQRPIIAGRVLNEDDNQEQSPVAVLTEFGARKILATKNTIGQSLRIGGDYFEIIGIVKSESGEAGNIQIPDQQVDVYIPINIALAYFGDITTKRTAIQIAVISRGIASTIKRKASTASTARNLLAFGDRPST